jgi:hypothetical protein
MVFLARGLVLVCLAVGTSSTAVDVTPLQKVIQLLDGMLTKGKAEKHAEQVDFAKFHQWCDSTRAAKTKSIEEAASQIVQLNADIAKAESDAEELAGEIAELDAAIVKNEADAKSATEERDREHADYAATHQDFSESIDAIERAIQVLKSRGADVPQSLLQLRASPVIPARAKAAIESFLAMDAGEAAEAPEANAYEFQSGGVVALLEKLRLKFQDQRLVLEKEEMNARANFETLMQQLTDDIKSDKDNVAEKTAARAGRLEDAAQAKGDLESTEAGKAEDEKALSDMTAECTAKSEEFEKNQVMRAAEMEAIEKAIEILSSEAVTGNAAKYLPAAALLQAKGASLAQLRNSANDDIATRRRVAAFLQGRARDLGSRYLSLIAARATEDPFGKVKKMIKDLIVKLMEQANSEADHKAYCDTELATNKQTRENKAAEVEELTASVEKHTAESEQLAVEITQLSDAIAEIRKQQAEATSIRGEEKATNAVTVADAKEAQAAVEKATQVLKEFYAMASESSLLQGGAGLGQEMSQAIKVPYKGMQAESGGIVGFLEVILSDFARLEAETSTAEDQAQSDYEKFMNESNEDAAVKETEVNHKTNKKQQTDEANQNLKKELELTQEELDKALDYYEKLKPDCVDMGFSYEQRVAMRKEEIVSLQEALKILTGEQLA